MPVQNPKSKIQNPKFPEVLFMFQPFRTAAVLGSGVMGTQIAAHLANAGLTVHLLDMPAPGHNKNAIVETAFQKALKQSPAIFLTDKIARRVHLGNFEDDFHRIAEVDWVIEVIIENLAIKQQMMERIESTVAEHTIVSSNTSGLPISAIAQHRSEFFRRRFLGTHFFNPPRYLKLLELIPTADTEPEIVERLAWFGKIHLGKGIVIAKDTPNFIGNRIGIYATLLGIQALTSEQGEAYTIEEIDCLTGSLVGRPKSATFRTADLVGLDTLLYVTENLYPAIPHDESRELFKVPALVRKLVETGTLGAKTGQGFYKKDKQGILSLNPQTLNYEPAQPLNLGEAETLSKQFTLQQRLDLLYQDAGRAGSFFRSTTLKLLNYAANRIPEIADNPRAIDDAMRWGFAWEMGPFELWDVLGFERVLADMKQMNLPIPKWIELMRDANLTHFYRDGAVYSPHYTSNHGYEPLEDSADLSLLKQINSDPRNVLWENPEAALIDIGDGVVLYEFRSKGNTLSRAVIQGLTEVLDQLTTDDALHGLVIGNSGDNFSAGANLLEIATMGQQGDLQGIEQLIHQFQQIMQRIHHFHKPIVAAVRGRVLGGGCELMMACPQVVAAAESYIGLVELGVGVIPAGGGLLRMAKWAGDRAPTEAPHHVQPFLISAFQTIATAKVSSSAMEAQMLGFLPCTTKMVMHSDRHLYVAKQEVLRLAVAGYTPIPENDPILVLGQPARAILENMAHSFEQGGFASAYDRHLATQLAAVLTGGQLSAPAYVDADYILDLERTAFVALLQQTKTQERIAHMLQMKRPLRN
jgi:3-hydroxyacyl-CoA dehydrogenase